MMSDVDHWDSSCLKPDLIESLSAKAVDYALANGICLKSKNESFGNIGILPFTLFPSPFPKNSFYEAHNIQSDINALYLNIANDHDFLVSSLKSTIESDDFMKRLFDIYLEVRKEGRSQQYSFAVIRTDYLLNKMDNKFAIKQVETNTIASSFSPMASKVSNLHRYILKDLPETVLKYEVIANNACQNVANGFYEAWKLYNNPSSAIIFLVEETNLNILDQRHLEYELLKLNDTIKVFYATFKNIHENASLNSDNVLFYEGKEIALVYFRTGYHIKLFNSEKDWMALHLLERSKAIKCPNVQFHLAGCKKVQQILYQPGVLEIFIENPSIVSKIRNTFAAMYSLDLDEDGDKNAALGILHAHNYVLKPQREGGGNNLYDDDLKTSLIEMENSPNRQSYILMERIFPSSISNYLVRKCQPVVKEKFISELGIYGYIIGNGSEIVSNSSIGHILRSKIESANEGGIVIGHACIDSLYLI